MITTVIIEDEKLAARRLERILANYKEIKLVKTLHSVEESLLYFKENESPDLIFSDIVLGDGLSFDVFETVDIDSFIIYTTAFDQYTLRAFKLNSIDYLLKPIEKEEVKSSIEKYKSYRPELQNYTKVNFKEMINTNPPTISRIVSKTGHHLTIIPIENVIFFYSENKIVYAKTKERDYPTEFTLDELDNVLDISSFFRVNRQTIIQLDYIEKVRAASPYTITMKSSNTDAITISRDRVKKFKEWIA